MVPGIAEEVGNELRDDVHVHAGMVEQADEDRLQQSAVVLQINAHTTWVNLFCSGNPFILNQHLSSRDNSLMSRKLFEVAKTHLKYSNVNALKSSTG